MKKNLLYIPETKEIAEAIAVNLLKRKKELGTRKIGTLNKEEAREYVRLRELERIIFDA